MSDAKSMEENDFYGGFHIGNIIIKGNKYTHKGFEQLFKFTICSDGSTRQTGGITLKNKKHIIMNADIDYDEMRRIHGIFHPFGLSHPQGKGGEQGIMMYPPSDPTNEDALQLSTTDFLPTIKR